MALKFLNKKGWHTGSLRNIENVWKAEQKHDAEQKKLEELRKQIQEERERSEFRLLQEKAGLVPAQERLDFLYDSGLSVGRSSNSEGFKSLEALPKADAAADAPSSSASASKQPGALFEDKPQSANDAWRKLHSDPLLMIRQREQEALAKIKNNPVKMAMIKKSVGEMENKDKAGSKKEKRKKQHHSSKSKHKKHSDSEDDTSERKKRKAGDRDFDKKHHKDFDKKHHKSQSDSEYDSSDRERKSKNHYEDKKYRERSPSHHRRQRKDYNEHADGRNYDRSKAERYAPDADDRNYNRSKSARYAPDADDRNYNRSKSERSYAPDSDDRNYNRSKSERYAPDADERNYNKSKSERYAPEYQSNIDAPKSGNGSIPEASSNRTSVTPHERESHHRRRNVALKLTEEERAAKLKQMQLAAELHEEQRWKRIKNAEETDAKEAVQNKGAGGRSFLDAAQKSVYGAAEGGSASIAESVRRRTHYSQGRSAGEGNAFRR